MCYLEYSMLSSIQNVPTLHQHYIVYHVTQNTGITSDLFNVSLAILLKGTIDQKAACLCHMIAGSKDDTFKLSDLRAVRNDLQ